MIPVIRSMPELWLTPVQASRELGVSERTVRRWIVEGRLRGQQIKRGKKMMWRVERLSVLALREAEPGGGVEVAESGESGGEAAVSAPPSINVLQMDALVSEVRSLREENAEYRRVIEIQAGAVDRLRQEVTELRGLIERALPPPREEDPVEVPEPEEVVPWWRWLWPW
jgi:excisionase family DNA binding protein